jgi:hypothetical protein
VIVNESIEPIQPIAIDGNLDISFSTIIAELQMNKIHQNSPPVSPGNDLLFF